MENMYELLYMSRMGDVYARKALFFWCRRVSRVIMSAACARDPGLRFYAEDIVQEGIIAMTAAKDMYREDMHASPQTFLTLVMRRRLLNLIRYYRTHEYTDMWASVPLDQVMEESTGYSRQPIDTATLEDPQYYTDFYAAVGRVRSVIRQMTPSERLILSCSNAGMTYAEGAKTAGITVKAYDGRLRRLKKRVKQAIFEE